MRTTHLWVTFRALRLVFIEKMVWWGPSYLMGLLKLPLEYDILVTTYPNIAPKKNLDQTHHIPIIMRCRND